MRESFAEVLVIYWVQLTTYKFVNFALIAIPKVYWMIVYK